MGSEPNLSVKWSVTIGTMINFDGDSDWHTCKQAFVIFTLWSCSRLCLCSARVANLSCFFICCSASCRACVLRNSRISSIRFSFPSNICVTKAKSKYRRNFYRWLQRASQLERKLWCTAPKLCSYQASGSTVTLWKRSGTHFQT